MNIALVRNPIRQLTFHPLTTHATARTAYRKLAKRRAEASRHRDLFERLDPSDPGRPE